MRPSLFLLVTAFVAAASCAWADGVARLSLEDCLLIARSASPQISSARDVVDNWTATLRGAKSAYLPQINLSASGQLSDTYNPALLGTDYLKSLSPYSVSATQTVYDFGQTGGKVGAVRWNLSAARSDQRTREDTVALGVKTAYFDLLRALSKRRLLEATIREREDFLATTRRLYDQGRRNRFDVLRAQTDAEEARLQKVSADADVQLGRHNLLTAMGTPDDPRPIMPRERLDIPPYVLKQEKDIVEMTFLRRPEIVAQQDRVRSADQAVRAARAQHLPVLGVSGGYSGTRNVETVAGMTTNAFVRNWQVGATVNLNIFSGLAINAQIQASQAQRSQATHDLDVLEDNVKLEVVNAMIALREARARIDAASQLARNASEALALARKRFESGSSSVLDVTGARNSSLQAQLGLIDALADYRIAVAQLERAVGAPIREMAGT